MKELIVTKKENGVVELSGNATFEIKAKIKKYGFSFDWDQEIWVGKDEQFEIVERYITNFKSSKIEIEIVDEKKAELEEVKSIEYDDEILILSNDQNKSIELTKDEISELKERKIAQSDIEDYGYIDDEGALRAGKLFGVYEYLIFENFHDIGCNNNDRSFVIRPESKK